MDSELVFQAKQHQQLIRFSYKKENRTSVSDYVSSQEVVPSEVTPGQTFLYYEDSHGCLSKGKVTYFDKEYNMYTIESKAKKRGSEVRYSKGHGEA